MRFEPDLGQSAPWKIRFRAQNVLWGRLATRNPQRGLVCTNQDGVFQLYAWDVLPSRLEKLTDQPAGVIGGMISADGKWVYYLKDEGGNEIGHFVRVPFEGGPAEDVTPDMPPYASFGINQSRDGSTLGFTAPGKDGFSIYLLRGSDAPTRLAQFSRAAFGPTLSFGGELALAYSTEKSGTVDTHLVAVDTASGETVAELWDGEGTSIRAAVFSPVPGESRLVAASSRSGFPRPFIWDPIRGERRELNVAQIPGDLQPWDWSHDGRQILLNQVHAARRRLYRYNLDQDQAYPLDHPEGVLGGWFGGQFTPDGEILVSFQDPSTPSRLVALDGKSGALRRTILAGEDVPPGRAWESITFASENGDAIQAWLAVPEGDGPFPTILHTHGGPTAVQTASFNPEAQAFLDHGFAFLSVNYHGSTTFGKEFEQSIWGRLGALEVQDMAAAYGWLVENRVALPESVLLTGGSYGGYLTLHALVTRPDLWAGGMGVVAIADWFLMYEDQADTLRGIQRALFGGTPQEKPEAHRSSSPITYAENLRAPLLVIQGRNDTRCPARQMEVFEQRLKDLGKPIEIHWFDAGHGSLAQEEQIQHTEMKLRFAYRVLG